MSRFGVKCPGATVQNCSLARSSALANPFNPGEARSPKAVCSGEMDPCLEALIRRSFYIIGVEKYSEGREMTVELVPERGLPCSLCSTDRKDIVSANFTVRKPGITAAFLSADSWEGKITKAAGVEVTIVGSQLEKDRCKYIMQIDVLGGGTNGGWTPHSVS